jgi:hypothetical protein
MCKEMPVIPVNRVVDPQKNWKKWRAKEEEWHKGLMTPPNPPPHFYILQALLAQTQSKCQHLFQMYPACKLQLETFLAVTMKTAFRLHKKLFKI